MTERSRMIWILLSVGLLVPIAVVAPSANAADVCDEDPTFGHISGSRDTVVLSGTQAARCNSFEQTIASAQTHRPYYTEQIVCSTDSVEASEGTCSAPTYLT